MHDIDADTENQAPAWVLVKLGPLAGNKPVGAAHLVVQDGGIVSR